MTLNVLSLFAGIGGLELGLERAGMQVVGQVEIDPFCRKVLAKHWPEVPRHDDVRTCVDWWRGRPRPAVHVVAGGFPCQPASYAGLGLAEQDERWLWPEMAAVIDAFRPQWVIGENVPGLLNRGIRTVVGDLRRLGYEPRVGLISACAVGAPHMRERVFVLAHADGEGRCPWRPAQSRGGRAAAEASRHVRPGGCGGWSTEPDVDRVAYGVPAGVDRRRALGNAVVPQVAEHIGRLIVAADSAPEDTPEHARDSRRRGSARQDQRMRMRSPSAPDGHRPGVHPPRPEDGPGGVHGRDGSVRLITCGRCGVDVGGPLGECAKPACMSADLAVELRDEPTREDQ